MVSDTKGKASHVTFNDYRQSSSSSRRNSHSNRQPSRTLNTQGQARKSVDEDLYYSSAQSPTHRRTSSDRNSSSYNIPRRAESSSRDNSPVPLPQHQLSFRGQGPIPRGAFLRSIPEGYPLDNQQEQIPTPNSGLDNEGPVVPDIYPQQVPNQQNPMDDPSRYHNGGSVPGAHLYAQSSFTQGSRPADDPEKVRLRAELAAYQVMEERVKASEKQREREEQIRKETEAAFHRRMEDIQKAQEEAKKEIERFKKEAEAAAWERAQTAKREQEAKEAEQKRQAKIMESEIRIKIEMERKAEEAEKRARERFEHEMELRLHEKMKGKIDDFMELANQRFLTIEAPSLHQRATKWTESHERLDYDGHQDQQMKQQALPPSRPQSSRECPLDSLTHPSPLSSHSHRTENSASIANGFHGSRPPSVPEAPSQSSYDDEPGSRGSSFYSDQEPPFRPHVVPPPRGQTGYLPHEYHQWYPSVQDYTRRHVPRPPNVAEELAFAFAEILRNRNLNDRMTGSMMDGRAAFPYPSSEGQASVDPREYLFPADRASAFERHRERRERGYQQYRAQHFGETEQRLDPRNQTFDRPFPSANMTPELQQPSNHNRVDGDGDSDSDQGSVYKTPPESQAGDMFPDGDTARGQTVAAIAPVPGIETEESIPRSYVPLDNQNSSTNVNSSLEDSFRETKVAEQLSAATAHMNLQENPPKRCFVPGVNYSPMDRQISQYLITDNIEDHQLDSLH
ncbi:hypothetical protein BKA59DRAFT_545698 [Fusarium tricinctum]|uniref:Uncharacterized protein n=1 Tax=Fusarium tricinctum TaxID=61284 RepID=A0A8K0WC00_9HYPO|nr:hypothetical protein BKA59DRAFT_545698 [Fusarium tricinctum]